MHDSMPYDPMQGLGQAKVTSAWKLLKMSQPSVTHGINFIWT